MIERARTRRRKVARAALKRYRSNPVIFAREVLGIELWTRQRDIAMAFVDHAKVAVRSGHKCGKTTTIAVIALWWVCTRKRARVIFTAASARQVRSVLWKEIRRLYNGARIKLGGHIHEAPERGLEFSDGREVVGFSTDDPERMAGFSGPNCLFLADEASGIDEAIFEAIEGNRAGKASVGMISNPTKTSGTFYDAFHNGARFWHGIHISSEEVAREIAAGLVPGDLGLADPSWVEEKREEWGEDDPRWDVRVGGNFPKQGEAAVIPLRLVEDARGRWHETPETERLELGVDVARYGTDSSVIAPRRGKRVLPLVAVKGFDTLQVTSKVLEAIRELRPMDGSRVTIKIDPSNMGAGVADLLRAQSSEYSLDVLEVAASSAATSEDGEHSRLRDQVWFALRDFLSEGGALPDDGELAGEIIAPMYSFDAQGRLKVESKPDLRKRLGRSTDRADAVALAVYRGAEDHASLIFED